MCTLYILLWNKAFQEYFATSFYNAEILSSDGRVTKISTSTGEVLKFDSDHVYLCFRIAGYMAKFLSPVDVT